MCVPMASTKIYMNELFGTLLILSALLSTASAVDCHGKSFHCVNSTHFMICVDLGGGVSQAIDDFYIACPPPTVCQGTNYFECEFPAPTTPATTRSNVISETTLPWENIITSSSLDNIKKEFSENYINTERTTTVEYSVTTDTTVDVVTRTAATFNINNELNVTEIATTIVPNITTSPIETISQTISEDRSITDITLIAEGVTTSVIEAVTETVAETNNSTRTHLTVAGEESNTKAININTQTTTENIVITETETAESIPMTTEQIIQTTTDNPLEIDTSYLYTELPQVLTMIKNENLTNNTLLKKSSVEKKKSQAMANQNLNIYDKRVDKHSTDIHPGFTTVTPMGSKYNLSNADVSKPYHTELHNKINNQSDLIKLEGGIRSNLTGVTRKQLTNDNEKNNLPQITKVNDNKHDITSNVDKGVVAYSTKKPSKSPYSVFPEVIAATDVPLVGDNDAKQKNDTMGAQNDKDTTILDGAFTIETEQPTTIYEENFTKVSTQNTKTVNLDIVTTEAIPGSNVQLVTTKAPSLILSSAGTTTVDGAYTIETVIPTSEHPTTIYEDIFTKDFTQNIETVNQDIVTTEAVDIPFSNSDIQLVTTQAPSLTQSSADTTIVDGAYTIETVENIPTSEHPTTINEENLTKDSTQNIETVNLDIATTETVDIPFSNSDIQLVTTQAPSLTQSSADTTTVDGPYIVETVQNALSSEHPTTIYENLTKDTTQNMETVNLDIITTDAINIQFSNNDVQLVTTQVPSLMQSSADTTTLGGAFTIETGENAPSSEQPTIVNEDKFDTVNVDIVTTEAIHIPFSNSDVQLITTPASSLTQGSADTTTLDGAFTIELVENAPSSEQPTTVNKENVTKNSIQNIVNVDILTTDAVDVPFTNSNVQLGTTQVPSLTQSSGDTNLDRAFTIETVKKNFSTEQTNMTNEQGLPSDTVQNTATENIIITTSKAINRDTMNAETIYESSTIINDQSVMTEESHVTKATVELYTGIEQTTTIHEENGTGIYENVASQKVPIAIGYTQSITSNTQNPEKVKQDVTMIAEIIENGAITEQPITTNAKKSTTGTIPNVATEYNIIPTRHLVNFNVTTEVVSTPTTMNNYHIIQVASEDYTSTKAQLLTDTTIDGTKVDEAFTTGVVGNADGTKQTTLINKESVATDGTRNIDPIILPANQDHTATETVNVTTIISNAQSALGNTMKTEGLPASGNIVSTPGLNNRADFITPIPINIEQKITKLPGDKFVPNTELPTYLLTTNNNYANVGHANDDSQQNSKTEFLGLKRESNDISNQTNISQNGESQTIRVKKIVEGQDQTANINWNPFDNHLIDKSNQISELIRKSDVTDLNAERNDPNMVSSDKGFVSQQHILLPLLASNPSPAEIYNRKQSYNATTITQSSDGILATNGLPENKANVNSQPEFASLPTPKPVTLVKEHSTYLKTNTFASGGSVTLSSSKTVPTNANVADTKILDNTHNNKIIPILFSAGLESTVEETGSKVREIKSNVNVSSDNKKMENPKNSKTPITVDLSNIKDDKLNVKLTSAVQNDKIELQTNTHDLSETINTRITTEGYHNGMGESSNPGMLDILPLPINNIESRPSVANILLLTDVKTKTRNGNVVLTTESYKSETFYPTLANTPIQASVNGVHNTNAPFKNLPTFGGSTTVGNPQKHDITTDSTFLDVNSPTAVIKRADVSPPHPVQVGQVSIRQTNTPNNVYTTPKEQNVNETNSPQTSNARENEPQKNNSPINLPLSISTQKPYANTVQTVFQSVIPNSILPVTKQVANETAIPFTCVNGIRGRYSAKDDCRKFYICFGNNQPVVGNCPENTVFSDIKKLCTKNLSHCIRQNEFKCPSAGRFSDFMKDNVYYICVNHMDHLYRFKFQCQKGYIFNKTTVKCIESKEIESNESVSISSSDNSSQTGSSSIASSSINNNSVTTSRVSNNSSSDDSSSKTDDVSMTKKTNEAEETPEKSEENEDDKEEEIFECKKEGKFPIRNECRRYYLCKEKRNSEYRRKIKKCGSGRVFHKDKKKCVHADSYEC